MLYLCSVKQLAFSTLACTMNVSIYAVLLFDIQKIMYRFYGNATFLSGDKQSHLDQSNKCLTRAVNIKILHVNN